MIWEKIALFVLVCFAIVGTAFVSLVVHEYSHYNDFKDYNLTDERLCGFVLPTERNFDLKNWTQVMFYPAGYLTYKIREKDMTPTELAQYIRTDENTEVKAYTIGAVIFLIYIFCYMIITFARYKDRRNLLSYKQQKLIDNEKIKLLEDYIIQEEENNKF